MRWTGAAGTKRDKADGGSSSLCASPHGQYRRVEPAGVRAPVSLAPFSEDLRDCVKASSESLQHDALYSVQPFEDVHRPTLSQLNICAAARSQAFFSPRSVPMVPR